jgi:hypothetical protein
MSTKFSPPVSTVFVQDIAAKQLFTISDLNTVRDKELIAMLLFIDFRKAFDLVESIFLLLKMFHYGFGNMALDLIRNYFSDRQQQTKVGKASH